MWLQGPEVAAQMSASGCWVALANVPVPRSLAGYQEITPFFLALVSPSPSPGGAVGVTACAVSVIDRPQAPSEGMRRMTLLPFRLDSVQRLCLKIELLQSFQAAGPVHGSGTRGFPVGWAPRTWKVRCIPGLGRRLRYSLGRGNCCNSRSDSEVQWASGNVVLGRHGQLVRGLFSK